MKIYSIDYLEEVLEQKANIVLGCCRGRRPEARVGNHGEHSRDA
jgi:hypothetical protein